MRILITDSSSRYISRALSESFKELGHESMVIFDDRGFYLRGFHALTLSPFRNGARRLLSICKRRTGAALEKAVSAFRPDAVLVIQGDYYENSAISRIKDRFHIPIINWAVHDPVISEFFDPLRIEHFGSYSHILIADELWKPCVYFFDTPVSYMPLAGDPMVYRPLATEKDIDILFVGDFFPPSPHGTTGIVHARVLERILRGGYRVQALARHRGAVLPFVPKLAKLSLIRGPRSPLALNALYNRATIVLNPFSLDFKYDAPESLFSVALSGAFQLAEYKKNIPLLFCESVICFGSLSELETKVSFYLHNAAAREHAAETALSAAMRQHTYRIRSEAILKIISSHVK